MKRSFGIVARDERASCLATHRSRSARRATRLRELSLPAPRVLGADAPPVRRNQAIRSRPFPRPSHGRGRGRRLVRHHRVRASPGDRAEPPPPCGSRPSRAREAGAGGGARPLANPPRGEPCVASRAGGGGAPRRARGRPVDPRDAARPFADPGRQGERPVDPLRHEPRRPLRAVLAKLRGRGALHPIPRVGLRRSRRNDAERSRARGRREISPLSRSRATSAARRSTASARSSRSNRSRGCRGRSKRRTSRARCA